MTAQRRRHALTHPPARPCALVDRYWALKIARAAYRVSGTQFRVYSLILELDRPDLDPAGVGGCYLGEVEFAQQCGRSMDVVTDARAVLVRHQLVEPVQLPGTRQAFWFARLPAGIEHQPPADVRAMRKGREKDDAIRRWLRYQADALDRHIRETGGEVTPASPRPAASKGGQSHRATGSDFTSQAPKKGGDPTDNGGQRRPPSEHANAGSAASSDSLRRSDSESDSLPPPLLSDSPDGAPSEASESGTAAPRGSLRPPEAHGSPVSMADLIRQHAPLLADEYERRVPRGDRGTPASGPARRDRAALDTCPTCGCERQFLADGARCCPRCYPAGAGDGWEDRAAATAAVLAHLRTHGIAFIVRDGRLALGTPNVQLSERDRAAVRAFEPELRGLLEPEDGVTRLWAGNSTQPVERR